MAKKKVTRKKRAKKVTRKQFVKKVVEMPGFKEFAISQEKMLTAVSVLYKLAFANGYAMAADHLEAGAKLDYVKIKSDIYFQNVAQDEELKFDSIQEAIDFFLPMLNQVAIDLLKSDSLGSSDK